MTEAQCASVDAVIESCVAHHDGDPGDAVNSLGSIDSLRDEILAIGDRDVEATMSFVALSSSSSDSDTAVSRDDFLLREPIGPRVAGQESTANDGDVESVRGGRFRVLRWHAAGGSDVFSLRRIRSLVEKSPSRS